MGDVGDARFALFEGLIDHAPLFPPASLSLEEGVAEDERARASPSSFMLGRFVCPASRLDELPDVGRGISVVLDGPLEPGARVEAVEAPPGAELEPLVGLAPEIYAEVVPREALERGLDRLAELGLRAKVRCGGTAAPTVTELSRFLRGCRERGLPFKATAGLHHALRRDGEHGFLNLLAAVIFGQEEDALDESAADAFVLTSEGFSWRGRRAGADEVATARRGRLRSIGSCSFFEPVAELEALGILAL